MADDKFLLRFPTTKIALPWSNLKNLTTRNEAQLKIEAWTPSVGSKGMLQTAWFRVSNIPADQRSIRTCAKVGGLVGKVLDVDESTRYKYDYVRMKIACRDVKRVPKTTEGTLGLHVIDFGFERELAEDSSPKMPKSGIVVSEDSQPPLKKSKGNGPSATSEPDKDAQSGPQHNSSQGSGKQVQVQELHWSAPPKIDFKSRSQAKLLDDAQKSYKSHVDDEEGGKVHIPETFEDSNSESDSFSIRVQHLTGMDVDQNNKGSEGESSKQVWCMKETILESGNEVIPIAFDTNPINKVCSETIKTTTEISPCQEPILHSTLSPEVFITDDNIINTQDSVEGEPGSQNATSINVCKTDLPSDKEVLAHITINGEGSVLNKMEAPSLTIITDEGVTDMKHALNAAKEDTAQGAPPGYTRKEKE